MLNVQPFLKCRHQAVHLTIPNYLLIAMIMKMIVMTIMRDESDEDDVLLMY